MLHIIQNDPEVPPGNLLESLQQPYLLHHPYRDGQLPSCNEISGLIVLGGALGANDDAQHPFLAGLKRLVREVVTAGTPYLGICLGGQLLAAALGAPVVADRWEELGTHAVQLTAAGRNDPLFAGIAEQFSTFQWHHDSFDLPQGALLLAESAACPHQAFRVGTNAWGLQFHPEVTEQSIRSWCCWDPITAIQTGQLLVTFAVQATEYQHNSRLLMQNFLRLAHTSYPTD